MLLMPMLMPMPMLMLVLLLSMSMGVLQVEVVVVRAQPVPVVVYENDFESGGGASQMALDTGGTGNLAAAACFGVTHIVDAFYAACSLSTFVCQASLTFCQIGLCAPASAIPLPATPGQTGGPFGIPDPNGGYFHTTSRDGITQGCTNAHYWANDGICMGGGTVTSETVTPFSTSGFDSCDVEFWWLGQMEAAYFGSIWFTVDNGTVWTEITNSDLNLQSTWVKRTIPAVPNLAGNAAVRLAFRTTLVAAQTGGAEPSFSLDDVRVLCTSGAAPTTAASTSSTTATISTTSSTSSSTTSMTLAPRASDSSSGAATPFPWLYLVLIGVGAILLCCCVAGACLFIASRRRQERDNSGDLDEVQLQMETEYEPLSIGGTSHAASPGEYSGVSAGNSPLSSPAAGGPTEYRPIGASGHSTLSHGSMSPSATDYQPIGTTGSLSGATTPDKQAANRKRGMGEAAGDIDPTELVMGEELGRGGVGVVLKGTWRATEVAVKRLDSRNADAFMAEAELMRGVRPHPNVLLYLGVCRGSDFNAIVLEYMPNGSLYDLLHDPNQAITDANKVAFALGVAKGMLHLTSEKIAHRDLAARNVLLSAQMVPKISDFGLARVLAEDTDANVTDSHVAPLKWMAPEAIVDRHYSEASDVWAFGVTCMEIATREDPYPDKAPSQVVADIGLRRGMLSAPSGTPSELAAAITSSLKWEAAQRATFAELCRILS